MMTSKRPKGIKWSECWEQREARSICHWIICWSKSGSFVVGAIGGYSRGGAFQLEKFAVPRGGDVIIEKESDFSRVPSDEGMELAEDCLDKALSFHMSDEWTEAETLYLDTSAAHELRQEGDLLFGGNHKVGQELVRVFDAVGLTARPS